MFTDTVSLCHCSLFSGLSSVFSFTRLTELRVVRLWLCLVEFRKLSVTTHVSELWEAAAIHPSRNIEK